MTDQAFVEFLTFTCTHTHEETTMFGVDYNITEVIRELGYTTDVSAFAEDGDSLLDVTSNLHGHIEEIQLEHVHDENEVRELSALLGDLEKLV